VNQDSVHVAGRRVVISAAKIDGAELEPQRLFFRRRCASRAYRFAAKFILLPESKRAYLNTSAARLLKRVRELQHPRFVKRRAKDL
jgi:hypothetical protein